MSSSPALAIASIWAWSAPFRQSYSKTYLERLGQIVSVNLVEQLDVDSPNNPKPSWLCSELGSHESSPLLTKFGAPLFQLGSIDEFEVLATLLVPYLLAAMRQFLIWSRTKSVATTIVYVPLIDEIIQVRGLKQAQTMSEQRSVRWVWIRRISIGSGRKIKCLYDKVGYASLQFLSVFDVLRLAQGSGTNAILVS
jgi:hypothetical protein